MNEISTPLAAYAESYTSGESTVLAELREYCYREMPESSSMLSGFFQGRVLSMLSHMIGPRIVLEIGTYLGYSALCLAEGLADGGKVITMDIQEETNRIAKSYVARTGYADRIEFLLGQAADLIPGLPETPDVVFIDADKTNYSNYFDLVIDDNVLWSGRVLEAVKAEDTQALSDFNEKVLADDRVENVLLPIRDGLMLIRKKLGRKQGDESDIPVYELVV
jgi:caffeoyl-CoA O-methyltransferase